MSATDENGSGLPALTETLESYLAEVPPADQADALHQVFYGFYTRIAIIDRTTYELAEWAKSYAAKSPDAPAPLAEALRDNALYVGQEIFTSRLRAMSALAYISRRLAEVVKRSTRRPARTRSRMPWPSTSPRAGCARIRCPSRAGIRTFPTTRSPTIRTPSRSRDG